MPFPTTNASRIQGCPRSRGTRQRRTAGGVVCGYLVTVRPGSCKVRYFVPTFGNWWLKKTMWKNLYGTICEPLLASGSQKRKRKKEKQWSVEAAKYQKLDKMLFARQRAPVPGELR